MVVVEQLRFLADESCDFIAVRALRSAGFEVLAMSEINPGAIDEEVLNIALKEHLVLLTEDKDFGRLFFARSGEGGGVIFIRFPVFARSRLGEALVELVRSRGSELADRFVVLEPGRARVRRRK